MIRHFLRIGSMFLTIQHMNRMKQRRTQMHRLKLQETQLKP